MSAHVSPPARLRFASSSLVSKYFSHKYSVSPLLYLSPFTKSNWLRLTVLQYLSSSAGVAVAVAAFKGYLSHSGEYPPRRVTQSEE